VTSEARAAFGRLLDAASRETAAAEFRELDTAGVLTVAIPELNAGRGFEQPERHQFDVLNHQLETVASFDRVVITGPHAVAFHREMAWFDVDAVLNRSLGGIPVRVLLRLSCLVHDVAKPHVAVWDNDRLRFPRHGRRGAELMAERLPALGMDQEAVDFVARMIRYHLRPGEFIRSWPPTDRAMRRFTADLHGEVLPLMVLQLCDGMATRGRLYSEENFTRHLRFLNYVVAHATILQTPEEPPLLNGDEVKAALGIPSGRLLGAVLTSVRRAQLERSIASRDEAIALARVTLAELSDTEF
jgi:poly(A) polymerase